MFCKKIVRGIAVTLMTGSIVAGISSVAHAESDSVAHVYQGASQTNITSTVMSDLGLDDTWSVCRNSQIDPSIGYVNLNDGQLLVSIWSPYGTTPATQADFTVQACTDTVLGPVERVSVVIDSVFDPAVSASHDSNGRCRISGSNSNAGLTTTLQFASTDYTSTYHRSMMMAPSQSNSFLFRRSAPKKLWMNYTFFNYEQYGYGPMYALVNTHRCSIKLNPVLPGK